MNLDHILRAQSHADFIQRDHAVDDRGGGTDGDQRIHVRRAPEQVLETVGKVVAVDDHNRQTQQKLRQRKVHRVFMTEEKRRKRPAHHVAHRQIEQRKHEDDGDDKMGLHRFDLLLHRIFRG